MFTNLQNFFSHGLIIKRIQIKSEDLDSCLIVILSCDFGKINYLIFILVFFHWVTIFWFNIYLFIWLYFVLVAANRIFDVSCRTCSWGTWTSLLRRHTDSIVAACGLNCPEACGILVLPPGTKPASPALQGRFLTIGPQGKFLIELLFINHTERYKCLVCNANILELRTFNI